MKDITPRISEPDKFVSWLAVCIAGLKPLTSGKGSKKELEAVENSRKLREEQEAAVAKATMQAKIEKARNRRLLNQKLVGKSLGEQLEEEEDLASASKWIERSRRMEEERKRKAQEEAERAKKAAKRAPGTAPSSPSSCPQAFLVRPTPLSPPSPERKRKANLLGRSLWLEGLSWDEDRA